MTTKLAIIVEWDNARLSEVDRAKEMLRQLSLQVPQVARDWNGKVDLLLVVDPDEIPEEVPRRVLDECVDGDHWPGSISLVSANGRSYYDQKNFGVQQTDAEFVVFIDSDVIPDEGWMMQICDALRDPNIDVVGGETYLSTESLYDRLCAAFWNFDVSPEGNGIYEAKNFYANNVAFRGDIIRSNPFPQADTFRGQCSTLAKSLRAKGLKLFRIRSATVSHPPPEGTRHFVYRAICQGHDALLNSRNKRHAVVLASPLGSLWRFAKGTFEAPKRIWSRRHKAGIGVAGMIGAFALSVTYSTLMLFGEIATLISPRFVREHFAV